MRRCEHNLNHLFEDDEAVAQQEYMGECQGKPIYKTIYTCPYCGTDEHYEVKICLGCGTIMSADDSVGGFCDKCESINDMEVQHAGVC